MRTADLRAAVRHLLRDPAYALLGILTFAIGIAATTAVFAVVRGVLLRPLPFPEPGRLISVCDTHPSVAGFCVMTPPDAAELGNGRTIEAIGLGRDEAFRYGGRGRTSVSVLGGLATPSFFASLRAPVTLGRLFAADDQSPRPRKVALVSHRFWRDRLGGDPGAVGRAVDLDGGSYQVIGVLAEEVRVPGLEGVEVWVPLPFDPGDEANRGWRGFRAVARLAPGVTRAAAAVELAARMVEIVRRHPEDHAGSGIRIAALSETVVGRTRPVLLLFLGSVAALLLIGCASLANVVLARGVARGREFSTRVALGASVGRLVGMLVTEQAVIAVLGGALGLLGAQGLVRAFLAWAPASFPRLDQVRVDGLVGLFATALSLVAGVVAGLLPALRAARVDPAAALAGAGRASPPAAGGLRRGLVVAQVALAVVLTLGAGLLGRSMLSLVSWNPGFPLDRLATVWLRISPDAIQDAGRLPEVFARAAAAARAVPGVERVATVSNGPLFGGEETGQFESNSPGVGPVTARWFDAGVGFFGTLGVALRAGREFFEADRTGAPLVAVVNVTAARRLWPGLDPVGRRLIRASDRAELEVVGVVADVAPTDPAVSAEPAVFWPFAQAPRWASYLVIRGAARQADLAARLAEAVPEVEPGRLTSYRESVDRVQAGPRFNLSLSGGFALVALALALVGIYGVITYAVTSRQREIGIRIAVGARPAAIGAMILAEGGRLGLAGIAIGSLIALAAGRWVRGALIGVTPTDPVTFLVVAAALLIAALGAAALPAWRAARIAPAVLLRTD